jgi:integrase
MDEPTMKKLWTYNTGFPVESSTSYGSTSKKRKQEHPEDWAGHSIRMMLQLLYIVSMLCLLRYDEALRITWQDVTFDMETGVLRIRLDLPFRKTHQNGGK